MLILSRLQCSSWKNQRIEMTSQWVACSSVKDESVTMDEEPEDDDSSVCLSLQ